MKTKNWQHVWCFPVPHASLLYKHNTRVHLAGWSASCWLATKKCDREQSVQTQLSCWLTITNNLCLSDTWDGPVKRPAEPTNNMRDLVGACVSDYTLEQPCSLVKSEGSLKACYSSRRHDDPWKYVFALNHPSLEQWECMWLQRNVLASYVTLHYSYKSSLQECPLQLQPTVRVTVQTVWMELFMRPNSSGIHFPSASLSLNKHNQYMIIGKNKHQTIVFIFHGDWPPPSTTTNNDRDEFSGPWSDAMKVGGICCKRWLNCN